MRVLIIDDVETSPDDAIVAQAGRKSVPAIRITGPTITLGGSATAHIHGALPYLFFIIPDELLIAACCDKGMRPGELLQVLAIDLEKGI